MKCPFIPEGSLCYVGAVESGDFLTNCIWIHIFSMPDPDKYYEKFQKCIKLPEFLSKGSPRIRINPFAKHYSIGSTDPDLDPDP